MKQKIMPLFSPPALDAVIINPTHATMQGRVQGTDCWIDIDLRDRRWLKVATDHDVIAIIQAWVKKIRNSR